MPTKVVPAWSTTNRDANKDIQDHTRPGEKTTERDAFRLYLSHRWFALSWWLVLVVRWCHIGFLTAISSGYRVLLGNPTTRIHTLDLVAFEISYATLKSMVWAFLLLVLLQLVVLSRNVFHSIKHRMLVFNETTSSSSALASTHQPLGAHWQAAWSKVKCFASLFKKRWLEPVFYLHGPYYDHFFFARKYLEIISQLYQGYEMSILIANKWFNTVYVIVIVLHCVSTPLIYRFVASSNIPLRRFLSVLASAMTAFVNAIIIPTIILMPYVKAAARIKPSILYYPGMNMPDDMSFAKMVRDNQQLLVTSYLDFLSTWVPHWSLFSCLWTCEDLLRRDLTSPTTVHDATDASKQRQTNSPIYDAKLSEKKKNLLNKLLLITGAAALGIHVVAQRPHLTVGCRLPSSPWFAVKSSCVILHVNCYREGIEGNEQQLEQILSTINTQSVFQLVFSHCPKIQMPGILRQFHRLGGLEIYNSTLDQWPSEASIRQQDHPKLNYVFVIRTNLSNGIPDGLMDVAFPTGLDVVYFYDTNLTSLPTNLHERWRSLWTLGLELCKFERVPSTLGRMETVSVALMNNPLTETSLATGFSPEAIWLSNSSLRVLPSELTSDLERLVQLQLEHTQVVEVPSAVRQWHQHQIQQKGVTFVQHSLYGSPYCKLTLPEEDHTQQEYQSTVCSTDYGSGRFFQIEVIGRQRPL